MFGTTYICEQVFSVINISAHTWSLKLINDILKMAATQDLTPDIDTLVKAKRCQVSGVGLNR